MRAPRSLLLLTGGAALVVGAVVVFRPPHGAGRVLGGAVLVALGALALLVWFRQSFLLQQRLEQDDPNPPE